MAWVMLEKGIVKQRQSSSYSLAASMLGSLSRGLVLGVWLGSGTVAQAHGVTLQPRLTVEFEARYDSGSALENAQVAVFAPDQPETPVMTGRTDAAGHFRFEPDANRPGDWSVRVRSAGHGAIATIPIGSTPATTNAAAAANSKSPNSESTSSQSPNSPSLWEAPWKGAVTTQAGVGFSPAQRLLMIASVLWGLLGTALFFKARAQAHAANPAHSANPTPRSPSQPLTSEPHAHS